MCRPDIVGTFFQPSWVYSLEEKIFCHLEDYNMTDIQKIWYSEEIYQICKYKCRVFPEKLDLCLFGLLTVGQMGVESKRKEKSDIYIPRSFFTVRINRVIFNIVMEYYFRPNCTLRVSNILFNNSPFSKSPHPTDINISTYEIYTHLSSNGLCW